MSRNERGSGALRKLDRWLGIPTLLGLSLFKTKRHKPDQIKTIGVCVFAAIGDALLASSLLPELKKAYPQAKITVFATPANLAAFSLIEGYDKLVLVPITRPWIAVQKLRENPVDVLIDSSQWSRVGALVTALSGALWTIGFETEGQGRHYAYDQTVKHSPKVHELTNFRSLLSPFGIKASFMPPIVKSSNPDCLKIKHPFIVLHPWASGNHFELREWPWAYWVEIAQKLLNAGYGVVITGGPGDQDRADALCREIKTLAQGPLLNLAGCTLKETAVYLQNSSAVISVNTGTMHLAALLGAPLIALHGPTNPMRWGPVYPGDFPEEKAIVLGPDAKNGGAYLHLGFEYPNHPIYLMDQISVDEVLNALRKFSINVA